jgi:hypothetical protein
MKLPVATTILDLRFFQAAATIIPILLLALVFQARTAEHIDPSDHPVPRLIWLCMWALIALIAEGTSLRALAKGHAATSDAKSVAFYLVVLAAGVIIGPLLVELKRLQELPGNKHAVLAWGFGAFGVFVALIAWRATVYIV